jgi:hypothetical protein
MVGFRNVEYQKGLLHMALLCNQFRASLVTYRFPYFPPKNLFFSEQGRFPIWENAEGKGCCCVVVWDAGVVCSRCLVG